MMGAPERIWRIEAYSDFAANNHGIASWADRDSAGVNSTEYIRADIHQAALQAAYAEGLEAAARAVAVTVAPVQGTPYIIGPSKFCEAIRALPNKYGKASQ